MKQVTDFLLSGYPKRLFVQFILGYLLMQGNSLLASFAVFLDWGTWAILPLLGYLILVIYWVSKAVGQLSFKFLLSKKLLCSLLWSLIGMFLVATSLYWIGENISGHGTMTNQMNVLALLNSLSPVAFICYLLTTSLLEEVLYRGLLFALSGLSWVDIVLTSFAFAVLHQPAAPITFLTYFIFGLFLGHIRQRQGLSASIVLHILWNILVLILTLLQ